MNKIILILFIPYILFGMVDPYKDLSKNEKFNLFINYFLNEELKTKRPLYPVKEIIKDDGASLDPVKYEFYFSYIQRIKNIRQSRAEEQKNINIKYKGKVAFYNSKVDILSKYYNKAENLYPILYNSINQAFKVIYGKPTIKNIRYSKKYKKIIATLQIEKLYNITNVKDTQIIINMAKNKQMNFLKYYNKYKILISYSEKQNKLKYNKILLTYGDTEYNADFIDKNSMIENDIFNLNIKIDHNVFRKIIIKKIK